MDFADRVAHYAGLDLAGAVQVPRIGVDGARPRVGRRERSHTAPIEPLRGSQLMMPGMPDLTQIVLKAQQMQAEMERAQASLAQTEVTGSAGGGVVTAVVAGGGELRSIRIDPSVVDPADVETLEDLVVAAVHDARRAAEQLASSAMGDVAGSLDLSSLGLPGMSFPGFGGPALDEDEDEDDDSDYLDDDLDDDLDDEEIEDDVRQIDAPDTLPGQNELPRGATDPSGEPASGRGEV